jgi:hypothetical protein
MKKDVEKTNKKTKKIIAQKNISFMNPNGNGTRRLNRDETKWMIVSPQGKCECGWEKKQHFGAIWVLSIDDWYIFLFIPLLISRCHFCKKGVFSKCCEDSDHTCPECDSFI